MGVDLSTLRIAATKPRGKPAKSLREMGIRIAPVEEDEGNVDRYISSKRLAIDRRTGSGVLMGIMDKTLFTSGLYLREHFQLPVLIIEGQVNYDYSGFDPQAVRGAISAMILEYGVNVLSTPNLEETVHQIVMMARQDQIGVPEISFVPKRAARDLADQQRRVVEMLPGCGMVMARQLLQRFGSVERIVAATPEEFQELRGVGAKKAKGMFEVLHGEYEAVDTERDLEDAVERDPSLLFDQPVELLARQHVIFSVGKEKHVVDLVFLDPAANEVLLVELKRGRLSREHVAQLRRYLDNAEESKLLRERLAEGVGLRGVLATVEESDLDTKDKEITTRVVDRKKAIAIVKRLRYERLGTSL